MDIHTFISEPEKDYELIDSGGGEKLERYGSIIVSRPDPQALWKKTLSETEWKKAQAKFVRDGAKGNWKIDEGVPKRWDISYGEFRFHIKPSAFKHTGLFPEQAVNWRWVGDHLGLRPLLLSKEEKPSLPFNASTQPEEIPALERRGAESARRGGVKVLNLFGYTGGATFAAAKAGAEVVHVDGSKVALTWARENAELSGLRDAPIRWILDDAFAFVEREARRGSTYDAIIMDPPAFGRGPNGEVWKIEEQLIPLLDACKKILSPNPLFIILNGYASGYSVLGYGNALRDMMRDVPGTVEVGELALKPSRSPHLLPAGITARWSAK